MPVGPIHVGASRATAAASPCNVAAPLQTVSATGPHLFGEFLRCSREFAMAVVGLKAKRTNATAAASGVGFLVGPFARGLFSGGNPHNVST